MLPLRDDAFCVHRVATTRCAPISDDHKHRMVAFQTHAASQDEALCVVWRQLHAHPLVMFTDTAWWHFIHMLPLRDDALCVHHVATARCAPTSDVLRHRMVAFHTHAAFQGRYLCDTVWRQLHAHPLAMFSDTAWWHFIHMLPLRDDALSVHRVATTLCAPNTMFSNTAWWHFIHMLPLRDDALCVHRVATARCAPRNDVLRHRMVAYHIHADSQGRCTLRTPCGDS